MRNQGEAAIDLSDPIVDAFEARFENWRRWCMQKGLYRGRCGSAEGNWRSPQVWDAPNPRPPEINLPDAILVNRAYTRLAITAESHARVIRVMVFDRHMSVGATAKLLGVHHTRLDEALARAKNMLKNIAQGLA